MATLTFSLTSTPLTASKNYTLTDADVSAWIAWAQVRYKDQNGPDLTAQQALLAWITEVVGTTAGRVQRDNTVPNVPPPIVFS